MHSRKRRKAGFAPVKRYVDGGVMDCPNPPCPPPSADRVKSLIDSGMWKLGPNGELLRLSAEEINQKNLELSKATAMQELAVEDPATFAPTEVGFMTPERKDYLEKRAGELTPEEAREYATTSFDPFEGPNVVFGMAAGATPVDPVGAIIGQGLKKAGDAYRVLKKPSIPVMDEARIQAQMAVIRDQYNIPYADIVDGTPNNLQRYRQQAVEELVGKNASSEAIARAEAQIDAAVESYMPTAIEEIMKNSEGNILNIPNDTRRPELDRVRMRFLNPNSKIWQQANKEGMIPTNNLVQLMRSEGMSEMEKGVLEEAVFGSPIYDKSGNLLGGEEARKAQDAVMSAILRAGGTETKEFASGDISNYRINLNQLKGLSEMTSMTSQPISTFSLEADPQRYFGNRIGVRPDKLTRNFHQTYGLGRIGYNDVDAKTFVIGSDDFYTNVNHFGRGELSHFRVFTNDAPPFITRNFPGTEIDVPNQFGMLQNGRALTSSGAYLNWFQDMSRVPGGMGYRRGGNVDMPLGDEGISESVSALLSGQTFLEDVTGNLRRGMNSLNDINRSASGIVRNIRNVQNRAADVSAGRGSIVGPSGDSSIRKLLEFANLPNRRELIVNSIADDNLALTVNRQLDQLIENASKEQEALARLGEAPVYKDAPGNKMAGLDEANSYLSMNSDIYFDLTKHTPFDRVKDNFRDYDNIIDHANADFSFGGWALADLNQSLGTLEGDVIPMAKNRFVDKLENQIADLSTIVLKPNTPPQVVDAAHNMRLKLAEVQDRGTESFERMQELAGEIFDLQDNLRNQFLLATENARSRGVPNNLLGKVAVEEVESKSRGAIDTLKRLVLELEANRNNAALALREAAESIGDMNNDVVRSVPDMYESAKAELKNRIDNALQDQTALDYYDIIESQYRINSAANGVREHVVSGDIDNPALRGIFLDSPDADRFYVSEIQSDFVQRSKGYKSGEMNVRSSVIDSKNTTQKGQRMELDSFQKNWRTKTIQQAVLQGRKAGKNEILFPTYKTADKIQAWSNRMDDTGSGAGNRITYQGMDKHIRKATGIKPYKVVDSNGNEWWAIKLDPNQKYEFPDFKHGGRFRLRKR